MTKDVTFIAGSRRISKTASTFHYFQGTPLVPAFLLFQGIIFSFFKVYCFSSLEYNLLYYIKANTFL